MTLRAPLSVVIDDGRVERNVTRYASGLRIRRTAPGGDASCEVRVKRPSDFFSDLGGGDVLRVDGPNARTIWQGYLDNPGRGDGPGGQDYELSAQGVQVVAHDRRQQLIYVDTDLGRWEQFQSANTLASAQAQANQLPAAGDVDGLLCQFNPGQPVDTSRVAQINYRALQDAGQTVGGIYCVIQSGITDTLYRTDLYHDTLAGAAGFVAAGSTTNINTTPTVVSLVAGVGSGPPVDQELVGLRLRRSGGATTVGNDDTWSHFSEVAVSARRMLRDGTNVLPANHGDPRYVTASQVVEDLLGRMLSQVDKTGAVVEVPGSPVSIDQLAFPDGATAGEVLDHLMEHESGYYWTLGAGSAAGLSFAWRAWPTAARYEISTADGFDQPGGDFELCNRVTVVWTDAAGRRQATVVTATSATYPALKALEDAGRTKDAETVELPDGRGSLAAAQRIGTAVLANAATAPNSGTVVVRRTIVDLLTGRLVMPWEVEPGYLVRVRETGDLIRLTETEYDDDEGSVTLTLGNPQQDVDEMVGKLPQIQRRVA